MVRRRRIFRVDGGAEGIESGARSMMATIAVARWIVIEGTVVMKIVIALRRDRVVVRNASLRLKLGEMSLL